MPGGRCARSKARRPPPATGPRAAPSRRAAAYATEHCHRAPPPLIDDRARTSLGLPASCAGGGGGWRGMSATPERPILEVSGLSRHFAVAPRLPRRRAAAIPRGPARARECKLRGRGAARRSASSANPAAGSRRLRAAWCGCTSPAAGAIRFDGQDVLALAGRRPPRATTAASRWSSRTPTARSIRG